MLHPLEYLLSDEVNNMEYKSQESRDSSHQGFMS